MTWLNSNVSYFKPSGVERPGARGQPFAPRRRRGRRAISCAGTSRRGAQVRGSPVAAPLVRPRSSFRDETCVCCCCRRRRRRCVRWSPQYARRRRERWEVTPWRYRSYFFFIVIITDYINVELFRGDAASGGETTRRILDGTPTRIAIPTSYAISSYTRRPSIAWIPAKAPKARPTSRRLPKLSSKYRRLESFVFVATVRGSRATLAPRRWPTTDVRPQRTACRRICCDVKSRSGLRKVRLLRVCSLHAPGIAHQ